MGFFDKFRKQSRPVDRQNDSVARAEVAGKLAGTLWELMQINPKMLMDEYARVVLDSNWNVGVASGYCDPKRILGPNDVAFVLIREDITSLKKWIHEMQENPHPTFQQIATEEYAKSLVRTLSSRVGVTG